VPKAANASNSGVVKPLSILCLLTPFSQRQRLRQLCGFANLLFFIDEIQNTFTKSNNEFTNCRSRRKYFYTLR
jgi:hypothetical protein